MRLFRPYNPRPLQKVHIWHIQLIDWDPTRVSFLSVIDLNMTVVYTSFRPIRRGQLEVDRAAAAIHLHDPASFLTVIQRDGQTRVSGEVCLR
ncbi:hypothetical protein GWI33_000144 [Rhynchophorus ferrugineus]|uniref:Uncharacterized protein n=1 Tax=Rhynchophorus ferrugineus TaxID=354439 RepID=A0A834MMC5_RHYFE|nr:hypothetical protein GWI33_000144 [Rhynchophorus ferrugineus]